MHFPWMILLITALLLLPACRSEPIQFHTLTPILPAAAIAPEKVEVQIETVSVPPQVDRRQLVIRESNSNLAILEGHWWSASLVDELRSALAQQWPSRRAEHQVPVRKVSVRLDVLRLESMPGNFALLDVNWRLRDLDNKSKPTLHCHSTLRAPAGGSIDDLVLAHQHNVQQLASAIRTTAGNLNGGCPSADEHH